MHLPTNLHSRIPSPTDSHSTPTDRRPTNRGTASIDAAESLPYWPRSHDAPATDTNQLPDHHQPTQRHDKRRVGHRTTPIEAISTVLKPLTLGFSMASPPTESTDDTGFDEQALYRVVRSAVEDAILGVLGTLLLLAIAAFFVWLGGAMLVSAASGGVTASLGFGLVFLAFGLYLGAATLDLVPPLREWV